MITTFYPPYHFGGDAVYVQQLSNALAERGHEVHVMHCRDAYDITGTPPRNPPPSQSGIHVHTLHGPGTWPSPLRTQQTGRLGYKRKPVERLLADNDFDVLHFHNISLVGGLEVMAMAPRAVKLLTLHDYWLICPTHVMFRYDDTACTKRNCLRCQLHHRRPPQFWRHGGSVRRATRHLDRVLAGSRFAIDLHREHGLDLPSEVLPLFNPRVKPAESPAGVDGRPYFLFVGRLVKLKGLQYVMDYFETRPDVDFLVAGDGEYEGELRALAANARNVHFLGHRSGSELHALYRDAVATLVPSLAYEISPMVLGESWSHGTPVVARNIGALGELVTESGGGLCFEDPASMAAQLDRLLNDPAVRENLGDKGRETWTRDWEPDGNIGRYLELVDSIRREKHG